MIKSVSRLSTSCRGNFALSVALSVADLSAKYKKVTSRVASLSSNTLLLFYPPWHTFVTSGRLFSLSLFLCFLVFISSHLFFCLQDEQQIHLFFSLISWLVTDFIFNMQHHYEIKVNQNICPNFLLQKCKSQKTWCARTFFFSAGDNPD